MLWPARAMPPNGKIFKLDRFEDYLMPPFRRGLGFRSWWTIDNALQPQGKDGDRAIDMIRAVVPDYDEKVERDRLRTRAETYGTGRHSVPASRR